MKGRERTRERGGWEEERMLEREYACKNLERGGNTVLIDRSRLVMERREIGEREEREKERETEKQTETDRQTDRPVKQT